MTPVESIEEKLKAMQLELPPLRVSPGLFVGYKKAGDLVFISGQLPMLDGKPTHVGKLGDNVTMEGGVLAARQCMLNILAQLKVALDGDWSRLLQAVRVGGFVNCTPVFADAPLVINGASQLLIDLFGEAGRHARAAIGVASLPANAAVEVEATFQLVA
jgi:enamine deaminase RidA (YjgF/YER057c/UK114 family)